MGRNWWLAVCVVAVVAVADTVSAGVKGGRFEGTGRYTDNSTVSIKAEFSRTSNVFQETLDYGDGPNSYLGTYQETDLLVFSFWSATYNDYPNYTTGGISLLGFIATYNVNQTDGEDDFKGTLLKKGPSTVRSGK